MKRSRLTTILSIFVLLVSLSTGAVLAAPASEGVLPPLPEQANSILTETISAIRNTTCAIKNNGRVACWGENYLGQASPTSSVVTQITLGGYHGCALRSDRQVACWGATVNNQLDGFPSGQTFTQISAGEVHTCGIKTDGTLYCWGGFSSNVTSAPSGTFTQISAGDSHTCAIKTDGTLDCWGWGETNTGTDPEYGQSIPPSGTFKQISAGTRFTCGIRTDGSVACWGLDNAGQVSETPSSGQFIQVSAASSHVCAIHTDGTVVCWGNTVSDQGSDQSPPNGMTFTQLTGGWYHTCGLRTDGELICWGRNVEGQSTVPTGDFGHSQISAGFGHTCWLKNDGTIVCWGDIDAPPTGTFAQLSSGDYYVCAIKTDATAACWGAGTTNEGEFGEYGQAIPPNGTFIQISAGTAHTCAVQPDGNVTCWGWNLFGQSNTPSGQFIHVSAGGVHSCGLRIDGSVSCWGAGTNSGITTFPHFAQSIVPSGTFTQISAGSLHTCGLHTDGTLACWGAGTTNTGLTVHHGQAIPPSGTFTQVSAGTHHSCAIKSDGTLACWGQNEYGETSAPSGTFTQISAGENHTCGVRTNGNHICWGRNSDGQALPLTISGHTTAPGVVLHFTDDVAKEVTSDSSGNYSFNVSYEWTGIVSPSLDAYEDVIFTPASRAYEEITSNQTSQNYNATLNISGNAGIGGAVMNYDDNGSQTDTADGNGDYSFDVPFDWSGTVTPKKPGYGFTPIAKTYNDVNVDQIEQDYTATDIADVEVIIGGTSVGAYPDMDPGSSERASYAGQNNGPVEVGSTNAVPIIAAERVIYTNGGVATSFAETMALPDGQLDNIYWLPWYNNVDLDTQLRFGNVSGSTATVHVYIGGTEMTGSPFILTAGQSTRVSFTGINNGPVQIVSDVDVVAAERVIYKVNGTNTSFSEMMALPNGQLDNTYWLPWYNNVDLDTQLRFGNVSGSTATVHVFIGDTEMTGSPFILTSGQSTRVSFDGINNGPVQIVSDVDIVAAERVIYTVGGVATSFSETMALPDNQLDTTYLLPWYNNVDLDTQLRFGNVSGSTANVQVFIGGAEMSGSPFILTAGQSTRVSFAGINNGPVKIVSDVDIVAAERVIYTVGGVATSFSEMMGLPNSLLNASYWTPWYNNVDLDTQLRFGVP